MKVRGQLQVPATSHTRKELQNSINGQLGWKPVPVWLLLEKENVCVLADKVLILPSRSLVTILTELH